MATISSSAFNAYLKNNDFSSPGTLLSLALVVLTGIFIFLFNAMAMRRRQLDSKIHYLATILNRRRQIAAELLDSGVPVPGSDSMAAQLECDTLAAARISALPSTSPCPALLEEYRILGGALEQALPECRAELEHYNHLVEKPDSRWFTKLCNFQPRERF